MNLIELHILQSYPVTCLNRDDVGSPKSATFGGALRARLSSQCLKRATRLEYKNLVNSAQGIRGRYVVSPLTESLRESGLDEEKAKEWAIRSGVALTKAKKQGDKPFETADLKTVAQKLENEEDGEVSTALFLSPTEISELSKLIAAEVNEDGTAKSILKLAKKASTDALAKDATDICLFGRMVAADASLNVEGATMFSHALSTHKAANEVDFYSAVEEFDKEQESSADVGAAMIGTLEYNSATYYRYAGINLDLLSADSHLGGLSPDERRAVLRAFLEATLVAVPGARKNSMNGSTLPEAVLGIRKSSGQPLQLVNAFEKPVTGNGSGLLKQSKTELRNHHDRMKTIWGIQPDVEVWLGEETPLPSFLDQLLDTDV